MVEAVEKLVGRIRRNKNDVLSWTLCLLSAGSGGVSIANSLLHTNSLAQSRVV